MNPVLCQVHTSEGSGAAGGATMRILRILGATVLGLLVVTDFAQSQRGGAVRSGARGAVVGNMVGGTEGAEKGAKFGVVTGATRSAIERENTVRTQYQTTAE